MNNNIIYNNAYGILGLLPNASQKELARRVKEIEKYIQIGETPKFNYDFGLYNIRRTLQDVHDAFFNISNVNTQIIHHFFRIYANDGQQFDILNQIENNFTYAQIKNIYDSINSNNLIVDRNTAILLSLLLIKGSEDNIIVISKMCIDLWFSILNSKKYKSDYKKIFLLDDELGINENIFDSIEEKIIEELSILFSDISQKYENNQILSMFIEKFKLSNDIYNINVVENIYSDIQKNIDIMDSMNISEDGGFDTNEKSSLKSCLSAFQDDFNKLIELGLYENEKTIIIRDLVATKIRIQILDLFNNLDEDETALNLMKFAIYIVGTNSLKEKLQNELPIINNSIEIKDYMTNIDKYIDQLDRSGYISLDEVKSHISNLEILRKKFSSEFEPKKYYNLFDSVALKLRSIAIDYHNNKKLYKQSQEIMFEAYNYSTTYKVHQKIQDDLIFINKVVEENSGVNGFLKKSGLAGCLAYLVQFIIIMIICWIVSLFGG